MKNRLQMVEIGAGNNKHWKGWHNLIITSSDDSRPPVTVLGQIDPKMSNLIKKALFDMGR